MKFEFEESQELNLESPADHIILDSVGILFGAHLKDHDA